MQCEEDRRPNKDRRLGRCEANSFGAKLGAVLSSDISHFDVPDMTEVLEEAWELIEEKDLSEEDFHAFTFGNAVNL
jgi:hypothetical protein